MKFFFMLRHGPKATANTNPKTVNPVPMGATKSPPAASHAESIPLKRKPMSLHTKGKVRLKPGETAVMSYWEIAPGMNGMALITPEKR